MPVVSVTNESNYKELAEKAGVFGEVRYLTGRDFVNIRHSEQNEEVMWHLAQKLKSFDPANDFLIIGQNPYMAAAVFAILGLMNVREFCILRWDNRDRSYIPLWLNFRREVTT